MVELTGICPLPRLVAHVGICTLLLRRLNVAVNYAEQIFICKAEERAVAVATASDDNAADGDLGK